MVQKRQSDDCGQAAGHELTPKEDQKGLVLSWRKKAESIQERCRGKVATTQGVNETGTVKFPLKTTLGSWER